MQPGNRPTVYSQPTELKVVGIQDWPEVTPMPSAVEAILLGKRLQWIDSAQGSSATCLSSAKIYGVGIHEDTEPFVPSAILEQCGEDLVLDEQTTTRVSEISEPKVGEGSTGGRIHRIQLQSEGKHRHELGEHVQCGRQERIMALHR